MLQHLADAPAAVRRAEVQTLGIEWPRQSSQLVPGREGALVQVFLKVSLEHAVTYRVGFGAGV